MSRNFAILLLVINLVATAAAIWSYRPDRQAEDGLTSSKLKEGLTHYLADVTTPAEMNAKSAEIAKLMSDSAFLAFGWRTLTYRALRFNVLLCAFNVVAIGAGLWISGAKAARKPKGTPPAT